VDFLINQLQREVDQQQPSIALQLSNDPHMTNLSTNPTPQTSIIRNSNNIDDL